MCLYENYPKETLADRTIKYSKARISKLGFGLRINQESFLANFSKKDGKSPEKL